MLRQHHQEVIDRLTNELINDNRYLALIVGGSIVKGWEQENSDVDIFLVCTNEEFQRRKENQEFHYFRTDLCNYPGGYVDGWVVDLDYMKQVASIGNEPSRSAFTDVIIAFSHTPEIPELVNRIIEYPIAEQLHRVQTFYAHFEALRWNVSEALKRDDQYYLKWAISDLVLYGGRMILAHNKILYPYHKWFMKTLDNASDKPENLMECIFQLLQDPSAANVKAFCECILNFRKWESPPEGWPSAFRVESEWHWMRGCAPVKDW
ncbi:hypothetical protein [Paenibacillus qinlingensis]|uniref:Nucleotidyltransferase n=1 Tax=Paenibacillus qinlingensis TaxID=1837343 RepID=A0ABU1NWL9_9BACL|nr:hypothetical protein [Paenibacillus qinlingensis]MDR6551877.1 putative nucleotidyltransferase [Paenibacillus qinlingensis]